MARASVIMPAYNRADTILRAVRSVLAQTYRDWELIVVDDGSTDETAALVSKLDPRIRVIRQNNQGITGARNTGLAASTGQYIAFLDSDDEWLPHHLELCVAFLDASPDQHFVTTELREDLGHGETVRHYYLELVRWYPEMARRIGSRALDLPPGETDPHLRIYTTREPIGEWGRAIALRTGFDDAQVYSGAIFPHLRWGYLMVMQATVLTRTALEKIGPFDPRYRNVSDFGFMAELCRHYRANYIALPTCVKHELTEQGGTVKEGHLATGSGAVTAAEEMLRWFEELHGHNRRDDAEIRGLRAMRQVILAKMCFETGRRADAMSYLNLGRSAYPGRMELRALSWYFACAPDAPWSRALWHRVRRAKAAVTTVIRGELSPAQVIAKFSRRATGTAWFVQSSIWTLLATMHRSWLDALDV